MERSASPEEGVGSSPDPGWTRALRAGETLFDVGEPSETLYVVQAGEVALVDPGAGEASRLVARRAPGEPVGETDALVGRPRTLRAVAATDARLLALDPARFRTMCRERPEIGLRVVEHLARRAAELERRLAALGMHDLVRPLARGLLGLAPSPGEGARIAITLRGLAEAAGVTLREAHRGLHELFERKWVRLLDDALVLADPEALRACLGGARDVRDPDPPR